MFLGLLNSLILPIAPTTVSIPFQRCIHQLSCVRMGFGYQVTGTVMGSPSVLMELMSTSAALEVSTNTRNTEEAVLRLQYSPRLLH